MVHKAVNTCVDTDELQADWMSEENYERLARRRRDGESFDGVIDRLLDDDRNLLAGFGTARGERTQRAREVREQSKRKSKVRSARFARKRGHDPDE